MTQEHDSNQGGEPAGDASIAGAQSEDQSAANPGTARALVRTTRRVLDAQPLRPPRIDPGLARLPALERAAEVARYSTARLEYWISPGGTLRSVTRWSIKLALFTGLPTLIVGPVVLLLLEGTAVAAASLAAIAASLAAMIVSLIGAVIGGVVLRALLRVIMRQRHIRSRGGHALGRGGDAPVRAKHAPSEHH